MKLDELTQSLKATKNAGQNGVWVKLPRFGLEVKIARANASNPAFRNASEKTFSPFRNKRTGTLDLQAADPDTLNSAMHKLYADTVVLDWKVEDKGGRVAYSPEKMAELFHESSDLFDDVQAEAAAYVNFQAKATEADAKN